MTDKLNIGFAMCGSFCTFAKALELMRQLTSNGHNCIPIMSYNAFTTDTRFGKAEEINKKAEEISGNKIISTITAAEPIGPKKMLDVLLVEPCTGNTLAKLANSIADTPVTLAVKSQLRNGRPVVIAVSTNDGLAGAAKNIGVLMNTKNVFFIPYRQDDPSGKPTSLVADFALTEKAIFAALSGRQLQPVIY